MPQKIKKTDSDNIILTNIFVEAAIEATGESSIDYSIISSVTNNTGIQKASAAGYVVSATLRKIGKQLDAQNFIISDHIKIGDIGAILGGANKYFWVDHSSNTPSNNTALFMQMVEGSINQLIYHNGPNFIISSIAAEASDAFISGAFIKPTKENRNYDFIGGVKAVLNEGIMVGIDTVISTYGYIKGVSLGNQVGAHVYEIYNFAAHAYEIGILANKHCAIGSARELALHSAEPNYYKKVTTNVFAFLGIASFGLITQQVNTFFNYGYKEVLIPNVSKGFDYVTNSLGLTGEPSGNEYHNNEL